MTRYVHWLMLMLLVNVLESCSYLQKSSSEKITDKSISFAIYKGDKYNAKVYDCTYVEVHIIIEKVSKENRTSVWDTTFTAKRLKQYPPSGNALSKTVVIPNVADSKEYLEVRCIVTYDSKGSKLEMQDGMIVKDTTGTFEVLI